MTKVLLFSRRDPVSVFCGDLATDEEFECDVALQIHCTRIQSFCFDNDISIVKVSNMDRLAEIVGDKSGQLEDAHCVLITVCTPTPTSLSNHNRLQSSLIVKPVVPCD